MARALVIALMGSAGASAREAKLTAEEVVARHLAAIGSAEARSAVASRQAEGTCRLDIRRGGAGHLAGGKARLSSEGRRFKLELPFPHSDYWGETFSFDGQKADAAYVQPRRRSVLGEFLGTYDALLREGLVAGVLTTAWPLLDVPGRKAKLKYEGLKKVDDQPVHELAYKMDKGQGEMTIRIHLEPETFRHVRTVYDLRLRPGMGAEIDRSAGQQDTHYRVEETFSDFAPADGLTLPRRWLVSFNVEGPSSSALWMWEVVVEKVVSSLDFHGRELS